jgi:hypothetical protein
MVLCFQHGAANPTPHAAHLDEGRCIGAIALRRHAPRQQHQPDVLGLRQQLLGKRGSTPAITPLLLAPALPPLLPAIAVARALLEQLQHKPQQHWRRLARRGRADPDRVRRARRWQRCCGECAFMVGGGGCCVGLKEQCQALPEQRAALGRGVHVCKQHGSKRPLHR